MLFFGANTSKCSLEINQTGAPPCWSGPAKGGPEVVIVPVLFGLIFLLGMVGNTLVFVVLGRLRPGRRPSRSATNIFILNLSIADFSFLLFCVPFQATIYSLPEWIFGAFFCKWVHYLAMATMLVSIFTLVAMSVDRYIAVVHAKRSSSIRSKRNAALGVGVIWLLSLLIAIPVAQHQALMSGHQQAPNSSFCWENWAEGSTAKQTYKVMILLVGYLLPLVLITCCYAKVGKRDESNIRKEERIISSLLLAWIHTCKLLSQQIKQIQFNCTPCQDRMLLWCWEDTRGVVEQNEITSSQRGLKNISVQVQSEELLQVHSQLTPKFVKNFCCFLQFLVCPLLIKIDYSQEEKKIIEEATMQKVTEKVSEKIISAVSLLY